MLDNSSIRTGTGGRKILVLFSDMRQHTADLDLESPMAVPTFTALQGRNPGTLSVASLPGVQVFVLGVGGAGKPLAYWQNLQGFWAAYFKKSGATLGVYSVLRELPALQE